MACEILKEILKAGAELAEAGEFTKRAFFNHRIDLAQAEAVIDIITAKNKESVQGAVKQLQGTLSAKINQQRDKLIQIMASIQAEADFPEEGISGFDEEKIKKEIIQQQKELNELLETAEMGKIVKEGVSTIIIGKPNVGKSSLLNAVLGENRAIVTEIPGTTRDAIEEYIDIGGITLRLSDTAGIRETDDTVEQLGVTIAKEKIEQADLILFVADISRNPSKEDREIVKLIGEKKCIFVFNKEDKRKQTAIEKYQEIAGIHPVVYIAARYQKGLDDLKNKIKELFYLGKIKNNNKIILTNIRHVQAISHAVSSLRTAEKTIQDGMPADCLFIDLMNAIEQLGTITGMSVDEEIVDRIFRDFCVGK